jgi:hypothetical protein
VRELFSASDGNSQLAGEGQRGQLAAALIDLVRLRISATRPDGVVCAKSIVCPG